MIDSLRNQIEAQREKLIAFSTLDDEILNAKPASGGWSMLECVAHMNLATELYLDQIEAKIHLLREGKHPYKPTFLANYFINGLGIQKDGTIKFKMKTMKVFDPSKTTAPDKNSIGRLKDNFNRIEKILVQMQGKDPRSFKVVTALGPILKFYVGDALRFINAHNERHFLQLEEIRKNVMAEATMSPG